MLKLMDLLTEGVYDKSILKAIFMAGGPGSGKSYVAKGLFGIPDSMPTSTMYGLKVVNSDTEFEHYLRKFGFETVGSNKLELDKWPKEVWDQIGADTTPDNPNLRSYTKQLTALRRSGYEKNRLGMIIDGTARDFNKIAKEKQQLEKLGYDCYMVFVNTTLKVAQERNKNRARKLPSKLLANSWNQVQQNIGKFQGLFKGNFKIVDNSKTMSEEDATKKFEKLVKQGVGKFIGKPIKNPRGKQWMKNQLVLKKKV